jgi:exodeoxyribonuclease VII small subunit
MATKKIDYAELQRELDDILERLQRDEVDIDAATKSYERGMEIVKELEMHLAAAENKVTKLQAKFETK